MLFPYQHLPRCSEITCCDCIEIDTTRHGFPSLISAIPIHRTILTLIHSGRLIPQRQCPNQCAIYGVDVQRHLCGFRQLICMLCL